MHGHRNKHHRGRWVRRLLFAGLAVALLMRELLYLAFCATTTGVAFWRVPWFQTWLMVKIMTFESRRSPVLPPERPTAPDIAARLSTNASKLVCAAELFVPTNVWDVHLKFAPGEWAGLTPARIPPVPVILQSDGSVVLRNPNAARNGLAGVVGIHLPWSTCDLSFGDVTFEKIAVRFKGNGTFVNSQRTYKRPFKIDLSKGAKPRRFAERSVLNFHNLVADNSCLSDTLGYEFYRAAGLPAPRTAFARLRMTIERSFENRLLGLYLLVENPDAEWARETFGVEGMTIFKPVTCELFKYLGDDWQAYEGIYDPKTKLDGWQQQRLIDLSRLVTQSDNASFAKRIGEFVDIGQFARFLACEVLLANYDGILNTGQNFILYLDPYGGRFGFVPWDLDHSWGEFPLTGTFEQRAHASIWHPWLGDNLFFERMFMVPEFRHLYKSELRRLRSTLFVPETLGQRVTGLAEIIRPFVAEESDDKLAKFELVVHGLGKQDKLRASTTQSHQPMYSYKKFFAARAASVERQLLGRETGIVLSRGSAR